MKRYFLASIMLTGLAIADEKKEEIKKAPEPTIIKLDTGAELLRVTHDGKIYSEGELVTQKQLTIATKTKAYQKCARLLISQLEQE